MAANNNSSNCMVLSDLRKDEDIFSTILEFDRTPDQSVKEQFIRAFKKSTSVSRQEVGFFLEDRYMEPPERLPDSSILTADVLAMDRAHLKDWADDAIFFLALKYNTHL